MIKPMSSTCWRLFLAALVSLACAAQERPAEIEIVEPGILLLRDSCNVYAIQDGRRAILIDLGSGRILELLARRGVDRVEAIYLTHRDRDQWFGFAEAERRGVPVYAPGIDPDRNGYTSESIRRYWSDFYPVPSSRFVFSMITRETDYPQATVADGSVLENPVTPLRALATPGHTTDHVAYIAERGGRKIAFSGDLVHSRGKVWQGYQLDWDHWRGTGHEAAFRSLLRLKDEHVAVIAPAHGEVMRENNDESLLITADRVWEVAKLKNFELYAAMQEPPILGTRPLGRLKAVTVPAAGAQPRPAELEQLSEHLWLAGNNYFLLAEDGSCFAVDNNLPPDFLPEILSRIGATGIDRIWITHLHNDHVREIPKVQQAFGARVITVRELADLIEQPHAYLHPFSDFAGVKPDTVLESGAEFEWKGYRFRAHFAPGQTWFHSFLETRVDGHHVVFSGDSYYPVKEWDLADGTGGWSGLNRGFPGHHASSARLMMDIHPEWVLAEHAKPFQFALLEWEYRARWGEEAAAALDRLSPSGNHRFDYNPHVFRAYPLMTQGSVAGTVELRVDNPFGEPMDVAFRVADDSPAEVRPAAGRLTIPAGATGGRSLQFEIRNPRPGSRYVIPVEITARGRYMGEACFFIVDTEE